MQDETTLNKTRYGKPKSYTIIKVMQDKIREYKARQDKTSQSKPRHDKARQDTPI